jgi:hypothetical protein
MDTPGSVTVTHNVPEANPPSTGFPSVQGAEAKKSFGTSPGDLSWMAVTVPDSGCFARLTGVRVKMGNQRSGEGAAGRFLPLVSITDLYQW